MLLSAKQTEKVLDLIEILYPDAGPALKYNNTFELLIAVILSAQTTDAAVNKVTPALFEKYPDAYSMSEASQVELETYIKRIGLYKNKAKYLKNCSKQLVEKHKGQVPNTRKELQELPGVGRKTANVVLSVGFNIPQIAVDTHVERVSKRLKMVDEAASVLETEMTLRDKLPKERWTKAHHLLIFFGRYSCPARGKSCGQQELLDVCEDKKLANELKTIWGLK